MKKILILTLSLIAYFSSQAAAVFNGKVEGKANYGDNEYPYTISYAITYTDDSKINVKPNLTWNNGNPEGTTGNMYVYINGTEETGLPYQGGEKTFSQTYEEGTVVTISFKIEWTAGGIAQPNFTYTVGSVSDGTEEPDPDKPDPDEPGSDVTGATFTGIVEGEHSQTFEEVTSEYPYIVDYAVTYNEDMTLTFKASLQWVDKTPVGAIDLMYVNITRNKEESMNRLNGNPVTTETKYNFGENIIIQLTIPAVSGDIIKVVIPYSVGSVNKADEGTIILSGLKAEDIEMNSAKISYNVVLPEELQNNEDVVVTVSYTDGDQISGESTESPIVLSNLEPSTTYSLTLTAKATVNGEEKAETKEIYTIEFTTARDASEDAHFYGIANGLLSNSYLPGENQAFARREIPYSYKYEVIYGTDQKITLKFSKTGTDPVGYVPEVNISGEWSGDISGSKDSEGCYSYTSTNTFNEGTEVPMFFWSKSDGAPTYELRIENYKAGDVNSPVEYGEPVSAILTAPVTEGMKDTPMYFTTYLMDADGNFILTQRPELTLVDNTAEAILEGDMITLKKNGSVTLTASCNGLGESVTFKSLLSANAENLAYKILPTTNSQIKSGELKFITDGNADTILEFDCSDNNYNHTIMLDLGGSKIIEHIIIIWEGACASKYSVTLSESSEPAEISLLAMPTVFNIDDEVYAGQSTIYRQIPVSNVPAQFVTLNTTDAATDWGIKLRQIEVYGVDNNVTAVETVDVDNDAPVRYFNLNGVEVDGNLAPGIYVRVQGNKASKVLVK